MGKKLDGLNKALSIIAQKSINGATLGESYEQFAAYYKEFDISVKLGTTDLLVGQPHHEALTANLAKVTSVTLDGDIVTVVADFEGMTSFVGGIGEHKYISLLFTTGEDSIVGIKYHTTPEAEAYAFTNSGANNDVDEAALNGGEAGDFVLFPVGENIVSTPKVFMLTKVRYAPRVITVRGVQS